MSEEWEKMTEEEKVKFHQALEKRGLSGPIRKNVDDPPWIRRDLFGFPRLDTRGFLDMIKKQDEEKINQGTE